MTEIQSNKPKAREVLKDFLTRNPEFQTKTPKEKLEIADRKAFDSTLVAEAKASAQKIADDRSVLDPAHAEIHTEDGRKRTNLLIASKMLDTSIPITLEINKGAKWMENGDFLYEVFSIAIFKGEEEISKFTIRDYGDEFVLSHRYVNPKFRGQGFGGIVLKGMEELVKELSKIKGRKPVIDSFCSQLDVMAMYDSSGYESIPDLPIAKPHHLTFTEMTTLGDIMAEVESDEILLQEGDAKFKMGEDLRVQPRKAPAHIETDPRAQSGVGKKIAEAVRVHFRKNLDAEIVKEEIGAIRSTTADRVLKKSVVVGHIDIDGQSVRILRLDPADISDQDLNEHARNLAHMNAAPRKDIPDAARKQKERERVFIQKEEAASAAELDAIYPDMCEEEHFRAYSRRGTVEQGDQGSYTRRMSKGVVFGIEMDGRIAALQAYDKLGKTKDGRPVLEFSKASTLEEYKGKKLNPHLKKFLAELAEKEEGQTPIWVGSSVNPGHLKNFEKRGWHVTDMDADIEAVQISYHKGKDYIDTNMIPQGYRSVYLDPLVDKVDWGV